MNTLILQGLFSNFVDLDQFPLYYDYYQHGLSKNPLFFCNYALKLFKLGQ